MINANASATALEKTYNGSKTIYNQTYNYTSNALKLVQDNLKFNNASGSLLTFFLYQRVAALKNNTDNKMFIGKQEVTTW